ncbi:MAG: zinc-dependent peptidase [Planctomycetales bacterium]|nr:zinc-dependent peptidase [Planctomycetales bacterium]
MIFSWFQDRRRAKLREAPFPEAWLEILQRNLWQYACLTPDEQARLRDDTRIFVAEKNWEGCRGVELDDEMRVTVAGQIALLVLHLPHDYFDSVLSILLYPDAYLARDFDRDETGIVTEHEAARSGEAWYRGPVILSWPDVLAGGQGPDEGRNLVIHEFAHQLDMLNGREVDGVPAIDSPDEAQRWTEVLQREFKRLQRDCQRGRPTLLDCYGATEPSEFFAVASEAFFQTPWSFERVHPELYEVLSGYFHQTPALWRRPADAFGP